MHHRLAITLPRFMAVAALALLGACATTQRSSTGVGTMDDGPTQASAPASAPATTAAKASTPAPAASTSVPAKPAPAANPSARDQAAATGAAAGATDDGATRISGQEIENEKRALAEAQARINRLRDAQDSGNQLADAGGTTQSTAAQASSPAAASATTTAERPPVVATKPDDKQLAFPEDANASKPAASTVAVQDAPTSPLQRSVYFDFDKAIIKEQYDAMLKLHATFLESHRDVPTEIQGNCDERGSREYNLALGARRAEAVKQALELLGVDGKTIRTVSFGSEKPVAMGHDEAAYSQNRRADILH